MKHINEYLLSKNKKVEYDLGWFNDITSKSKYLLSFNEVLKKLNKDNPDSIKNVTKLIGELVMDNDFILCHFDNGDKFHGRLFDLDMHRIEDELDNKCIIVLYCENPNCPITIEMLNFKSNVNVNLYISNEGSFKSVYTDESAMNPDRHLTLKNEFFSGNCWRFEESIFSNKHSFTKEDKNKILVKLI